MDKIEKLFAGFVLKSVDDEQRTIKGMASTPTADRVNDEIDPMGLTYTKDIPLLLNHRGDSPVGTVQFGEATDKGLPFTATIAREEEDGVVKERCNEAWHSIRNGLIKGVSIGFIPTKYSVKSDGGVKFIKANVHELSLTALPCNPEARIVSFKELHASLEEKLKEAPKEDAPPPLETKAVAPQQPRMNLLKYL